MQKNLGYVIPSIVIPDATTNIGYWYLGSIPLGVRATGTMWTIGADHYWYVDNTKTEYLAEIPVEEYNQQWQELIEDCTEQWDTYYNNKTAEINLWFNTEGALFTQWFDRMKNQLSSDAAGHLQLEIDDLRSNLTAEDDLQFQFSKSGTNYGYKDANDNFVPFKRVQASKTVSPSTSPQTVIPDSGYDGLAQVTVNAISATSVSPSSSGTYFSSGLKNMTSSGYAYSSRPSSGYNYGWDSATTLWTNPSPSSNFSGQNITLNQGISNFNFIRIYWRVKASVSTEKSIIVSASDFPSFDASNNVNALLIGIRGNSGANSGRAIRYISDTSLGISAAYALNQANSGTDSSIPTKIIGLK